MTPPEAQLYAERILLCLRNKNSWEARVMSVSGELLRIWDEKERAPSHEQEAR